MIVFGMDCHAVRLGLLPGDAVSAASISTRPDRLVRLDVVSRFLPAVYLRESTFWPALHGRER